MSTASFRRGVWALGYAAAIAIPLVIIGCGGTSAPARPSPSLPAASSPAAGTAPAMPIVVSWRCLAQSASGDAGIFAAGVRDAACPAQSRVVVFEGALAAPGAPPSLSSSVAGSTVTLTWLVPTSPDPATSYVIEAGSSAGSTNITVFDTLRTATSFTATDVPTGTYFVRVRARNSAGTSAASNEVVVIVGGGACVSGTPSAPSGLTSSVIGSSVSLSWTPPVSGCATGYVIEAGSASGSSNLANFNTGSTATTFSAPGVASGTYYVRVRAAIGSSAGGPSNEITVIVGGGPGSPNTERDALLAFYNSTGGPRWTTQTNWNGAAGTECTWYGISCTNRHVTFISLPGNHLTGTIPSLTGLTYLTHLQVQNNQLTGTIPPLAELTNLSDFNGAGNQLTGPIPSITGLTNLTDFNLIGNQLTGTIPSLTGLTLMNDFSLADNQLTGTIPSLAGLPSLKYFLVYNNRLTGTIPPLTGLTSLAYFQIHNNQLTGTIPSLAGLTRLLNFNVQNNQLTGAVPDVPSPSALLPRSSNLCPNHLTPSINTAWDTATGSTPWSSQCS